MKRLIVPKLETNTFEPHQPTAIERAWLAGMFDGEGCLCVRKQTTAKRRRFYPILTVHSTDLDIVQKFGRFTGFGRVHGPYWSKYSTKPLWRWSANGWRSLREMWGLIGEHLSKRRTATFVVALDQDPDLTASQSCSAPSRGGYFRHRSHGEDPCSACRRAHAAYQASYRDQKDPRRARQRAAVPKDIS